MSWLARIIMPQRSALNIGLVDNNCWHKFVWKCFSDGKSEQERNKKRDFLTRLDIVGKNFRLYILAFDHPLRPVECKEEWWACKKIATGFLEHDFYRFSLRANPVRKTKFDASGQHRDKSHKVAILDPAEQRLWLERKAIQGGFSLDERVPVVVSPTSTYNFRHLNKRTGRLDMVTNISADFSGLLRVTDRALFQQTFMRGIGSSRAFGFGMLILQPIEI